MRGWLLLFAMLGGCVDAVEPTGIVGPSDSIDRLYAPFVDGKLDGSGHPFGATVYEADTDCGPQVGISLDGELSVHPRNDAAGSVCSVTSGTLGSGSQRVNVRVRVDEMPAEHDQVLSVVVKRGNETIGEATATSDAFDEGIYRNVPVTFDVNTWNGETVTIEVQWLGRVAATIDYVELFTATPSAVVSPASGVVDDSQEIEIEARDFDFGNDASFNVECNGADYTETLDGLVSAGIATETNTDFRRIFRGPIGQLFEGCEFPRHIVARVATPNGQGTTSEVIYYDGVPDCTFEEGKPHVLITGFRPFPAGGTDQNISGESVTGFDASGLTDISVMKLILPVEFDVAAQRTLEVAQRCGATHIVSFGQGRDQIDVETTARNLRDGANVAGGLPDNRGVAYNAHTIFPGEEAERPTALPYDALVETINARLVAEQLDTDDNAHSLHAQLSNSAGRYVCNDIFYHLVRDAGEHGRASGFIHLPNRPMLSERDRRSMQVVVEAAVRATVERTP